MKRVLLVAALTGAVASLAFASGDREPAAGKPQTLQVRYVAPGSSPPDYEKGIAAVNQKLAADGTGLQVQITYIPFDSWTNKTNVMLSSGEEFELINVMDNSYTRTQTYAARGAVVPLDDLIKKHAPALLKRIDQYLWDAAMFDGKIYSLPVDRKSLKVAHGYIGLLATRQDLLTRYGLSVPKTARDLLTMLTDLKQKWGEKAYFWEHENTRTSQWLHRDYDSFPFYVDYIEELIYVDKAGNVKAWMDAPEFKQDAAWFREAYKRGLIHPDVLSLPRDYRHKEGEQGRFLAAGTFFYTQFAGIKRNVPELEIVEFQLAPEKVQAPLNVLENSNAVPVTAKHPEAGIRFLDWVYASRANHDLFAYGIEGTHFKAIGENKMEWIRNAQGTPLFQTPHWMFGKRELVRFLTTDHPKFIENTTSNFAPNEIYRLPNVGFNFNTEPVSSEYANCLAERSSAIWPLKLGVVEYGDYYAQARQKMKEAGLDKVVVEYAKQFSAWRDKNRK